MISVLFRSSLCWLFCAVLLAACSKDDTADGLPPLVWPDDIAAAIPDPAFRAFCVERYDGDRDGRLSKEEVQAVGRMSGFSSPGNPDMSLAGIEYFSNIKDFYWNGNGPKEIDLRYNSLLQKIRCENNSNLVRFRGPVGYAPLAVWFYSSDNLQELELSGCGNVRELMIGVSSPAGAVLTTLDLPDPSHLRYLKIAAANAACYDTLLADAVSLEQFYCDYYPGAVLDLSRCPKLEALWVQTFAGSPLSKIRLRKGAPVNRQLSIRDENGRDCSKRIEIEYAD